MTDTTYLIGLLVAGVACVAVGMATLHVRLSALERRLDRLSRVDGKVDALLQHAGITLDAYEDVPSDVREAIEQGELILAIRRYREAAGVGLKEAKDIVGEVRRRAVRT